MGFQGHSGEATGLKRIINIDTRVGLKWVTEVISPYLQELVIATCFFPIVGTHCIVLESFGISDIR